MAKASKKTDPVMYRYFIAYHWQLGIQQGFRRGTVDVPNMLDSIDSIIDVEKALMPSHLPGTVVTIVNYQFMKAVTPEAGLQ